MGIEPSVFRNVLGHFPTGVTVVTSVGPNGPVGLTIGSFTSVSLEPPLVLFCVTSDSEAWQAIRDRGAFVVNVLNDQQSDVCSAFASSLPDRFAGVSYRAGANGAPVLDGVLAVIECEIYSVYDGGDHDVVVGRVDHLEVDEAVAADHGPLLFHTGRLGAFQAFG